MSTVFKAAAFGGVTGALIAVPVDLALLALQAPAVPGGMFGAAGGGAVVGAILAVGLYKGKVDRLERDVQTKADQKHVDERFDLLQSDVRHTRDSVDRIIGHLMRE
jgi:hypothetical protein